MKYQFKFCRDCGQVMQPSAGLHCENCSYDHSNFPGAEPLRGQFAEHNAIRFARVHYIDLNEVEIIGE